MKKQCRFRSVDEKTPPGTAIPEGAKEGVSVLPSPRFNLPSISRKSKHQIQQRFKGYIFDLCEIVRASGLKHYSAIIDCGNRIPEKLLYFRSVYYKDSGVFACHTSGQVHCGSFLCPVCGPVIRAYRAHEIAQVCKSFPVVQLWTFTLSHARGDALADLICHLDAAYRGFWKDWGIRPAGMIRSFECTFSPLNGWHPHLHCLVFWDELPGLDVFECKKRWCSWVNRAGGSADIEHGLTIQDGSRAHSYVCKLSVELTGQQNKDSLDLYGLILGRHRSLVREYYQAIRKRHFLRFSRGLRARVGLKDVSDEKALENAFSVGKTVFPTSVIGEFYSDVVLKSPPVADAWEMAIRNLDW